jgi:hypothetical protein
LLFLFSCILINCLFPFSFLKVGKPLCL